MDVTGEHALPDFEVRAHGCIAPCRISPCHDCGNHFGGHNRCSFYRIRRRPSVLEFSPRDDTILQELVDEPGEPPFVVAHTEIFFRRQQLELMTRVVEVLSPAASPDDAGHRIHPAFPGRVEYRFVLLMFDGPHTVHAAHVVHAVHAVPPDFGGVTFATPTIESRVTSSASDSSVMFSVPSGRSGSTIYRNSAVLSQTRISASFGSLSPNSRSTPRGSITARERYAADLYQTGGRPKIGHG